MLLDRIVATESVRVRSGLTMAPGVVVGGEGLRPRPIGALTSEVRRETVWWPWLGREEPTDVLETHGEVSDGTVFGWNLLRAGADVVHCDRDQIILSAGRARAEVPLTWRTGPLRV